MIYVYGSEVMGSRLRDMLNSGVYLMICVGGVVLNLLSIRFNHFRFYLWLSLILTAVPSSVLLYLVESPFHLHRTGQHRELYACLVSIARVNKPPSQLGRIESALREILGLDSTTGSSTTEPLVSQPIAADQSHSKLAFLRLFRRPCLGVFLKYLTLLSHLQLVYSLSLIINKQLGIDDVFLSGVLVNVFGIVSYILCFTLLHKLKRRAVNLWAGALLLACSGSVLAVDLISNCSVPHSDRSGFVRITETGLVHKLWDWASYSSATCSRVLCTLTGRSCLPRPCAASGFRWR